MVMHYYYKSGIVPVKLAGIATDAINGDNTATHLQASECIAKMGTEA
jgi:hypothetical protein